MEEKAKRKRKPQVDKAPEIEAVVSEAKLDTNDEIAVALERYNGFARSMFGTDYELGKVKIKKGQRRDIDDYKIAAAKRNRKLLTMLIAGYNTMHLYMSYDGDKSYGVSKSGVDTANDIIDWCEANAPKTLSGTKRMARKTK